MVHAINPDVRFARSPVSIPWLGDLSLWGNGHFQPPSSSFVFVIANHTCAGSPGYIS